MKDPQKPGILIPTWFNVLWGVFLGVIAVTTRAAQTGETAGDVLTGKRLIVTVVTIAASTLMTVLLSGLWRKRNY
ncbi:MAG TPA: hypothetical protein VGD56_14560 [Gemmatirosa sp.]